MRQANDFKGLASNLRDLKLGDSPEVQRMLADALIPLRDQVKANVHSMTGKTVAATEIVTGHGGAYPSAAVKVDPIIASVLSRGRRLAYPRVVEAGHGGKHPAGPHPFFEDAVRSTRAQIEARVTGGIHDLIEERAK